VKTILLSALLLLPASVFAEEPKEDGNNLLDNCTQMVNYADNSSAQTNDVKFGWCSGWLDGVIATLDQWHVATSQDFDSYSKTGIVGICFPQGVTKGQTARVIVKYLRDHPNRLQESQMLLTIDALRDAFPCTQASNGATNYQPDPRPNAADQKYLGPGGAERFIQDLSNWTARQTSKGNSSSSYTQPAASYAPPAQNAAPREKIVHVAPARSVCNPAIETKIDGEFNGWEDETIYKTTDGHIWQQSTYHYHYHYAYMPDVVIYSTNYGCHMKVNDDDDSGADVRMLK
jgi:hypothetical protein